MSPQRIQMKRTKGWRKPAGAVYVGRPTKWGNPYRVEKAGRAYFVSRPGWAVGTYEGSDIAVARLAAVNRFMAALTGSDHWTRPLPFTADEARRELRGRDLACWCPLDQPCHADVLLELANEVTS